MLLTSSCNVTCSVRELLILYKYSRKEAQRNLEAIFPRSKISSHTSKCLTNYSVHIFCLIPNILSLILTLQLLVVQGHDINTKRQVIKRENFGCGIYQTQTVTGKPHRLERHIFPGAVHGDIFYPI